MSYRCKQCTPPRVFGSVSKLRSHQWKEHREVYARKPTTVQLPAPPAPTPEPAPTPVVKRAATREVRPPSPNGAFGTLQRALARYEEARQALADALKDTQERMRSGMPIQATSIAVEPPKPKRHISPEGRARIAEAQRKRWAATKALRA